MSELVFRRFRQGGDARRGKEARAALRAGILATLNVIGGVGLAQEPREAAPQANHSAATADLAPVQADAIFENYRLRNGEAFEQLRLHYATLGKPHRNAQGEIDNAVMVLHWTGNSGASLLSRNISKRFSDRASPSMPTATT
jgi:homoserine O-acetyltransferase/O-succinyltransferase